MYSDWYANISAPLRERARSARILNVLDKGLVYVLAAAYLGCIAWLFATDSDKAVRFVAVPAVGFVLVSVIRKLVNAPRPYERYDIDPLIKKNTHGKSFPSRHIFSAAMIACAFFWLSVPAGLAAFAATLVVCFCRIVGGVHFPRDAVFALVFAIACGLVGFFAL